MSRRFVAAAAAGALTTLAMSAAAVSADSLTPIRMTVRIAAVARRDRPLVVQVQLRADPGVLDVREGSIRAQVRLSSGECGGVFAHTRGMTLLNRAASPQPNPGRPYSVVIRGAARPSAYGVQNVCAFLDDDAQQLAANTNEIQVDVSRPCTVAADRFDGDLRKRGRRNVVTLRDSKRARAACGPGVSL